MPIINQSVSHAIVLAHEVVGETLLVLDAYGSLSRANSYFDNRLRSEFWKRAEIAERSKAMVEATRIIDSLSYEGDKTVSTQLHQFPRGTDTAVPKDIEFACYEIAIKLLEGIDPDMEIETLASESQGYGGVRTTYNRTFVHDHVRAGVPSATAWRFLVPYLRDSYTVRLSRV